MIGLRRQAFGNGMVTLKRAELYRLHRNVTRLWAVTILQWVAIGFLVLRLVRGH